MKKIKYLLWIILATLHMGCNDDNNHLPRIIPETSGTLIDNDGNEYTWVRYNGIDWMTSNFKGGTPFYNLTDEWGYAKINFYDKTQTIADYEIYGNLYTHEEALANTPKGWRLPTDEDWKKLEQALGMSPQTADKIGWRGTIEGELMQQDHSGTNLNLLFGGYICLRAGYPISLYLCQMKEFGYYWTSTVKEGVYPEGTAVFYRSIRFNSAQIERNVIATTEQDHLDHVSSKYMSVRYVRNAQ